MTYDAPFIDSLKDHMELVLDIVVQTFGQAGILLPDRRYFTFGQPVHDCEQLTVQFQQLYMGPPGDQAQTMQRCDGPRSAAVLVELVRCIPTFQRTAPTVEQLTAAAEQQAIDAWMLLEAATKVNPFGVLADVSPGEPQGAYQAMSLSVITVV